jgi:hypothetical protein
METCNTISEKTYNELLEQFEELKQSHQQLCNDYAENTIVQSMNDMKTQYEELIASTVSTYRYGLIQDKYHKLYRTTSSAGVLIDHILKVVKQIELEYVCNNIKINKVQLELNILKEILEDGFTR